MGRTIPVGNPPIDVTLRKSAQARRMTLRVSRLDGRVTLSVPKFVAESEATSFARSREAWLRKALDEVSQPYAVIEGAELPVEGRPVRITRVSGGRGTALDGDQLLVRTDRVGAAAQAFLKNIARDRLTEASDRYAAVLGRSFSAITLRDTRSRWGSCTAEGRLMYSWRLAMAPPAVLDYVAAHEVAHLEHMDHSEMFWGLVADICPDHAAHRRWLRENGPGLHCYIFTN